MDAQPVWIDEYKALNVWFAGRYVRGHQKADGTWLFQMRAATFILSTPSRAAFLRCYALARLQTALQAAGRITWAPVVREAA